MGIWIEGKEYPSQVRLARCGDDVGGVVPYGWLAIRAPKDLHRLAEVVEVNFHVMSRRAVVRYLRDDGKQGVEHSTIEPICKLAEGRKLLAPATSRSPFSAEALSGSMMTSAVLAPVSRSRWGVFVASPYSGRAAG